MPAVHGADLQMMSQPSYFAHIMIACTQAHSLSVRLCRVHMRPSEDWAVSGALNSTLAPFSVVAWTLNVTFTVVACSSSQMATAVAGGLSWTLGLSVIVTKAVA
jgi:hypothetical protein